ncbi:hypothetical protein TNCV_649931 [Trichonephila clavipes]|nr:hypothetical protein TNCV_649931 [Trichonephila clavipes]
MMRIKTIVGIMREEHRERASRYTEGTAKSVSEPDEIVKVEEVVDLSRQIHLEEDSDGVQEPLDYHNQELALEQLIEMHGQE